MLQFVSTEVQFISFQNSLIVDNNEFCRKTDIDHRNLITLTTSPKDMGSTNVWKESTDQVCILIFY